MTNPPARSHRAILFGLVCMLVASTPLAAGPALAQDKVWAVKGKLLGKPTDKTGLDMKKSKDVSGIACATESGFPRVCLIADDESQGAQIVILNDGGMIAGDFIRLVTDVYTDKHDEVKAAELDAEAVAYSDGAFYVTGSHGRPRKTDDGSAASDAKAAVTRRLFRIVIPAGAVDPATGRLAAAPTVTASTELERLFQNDGALSASFDAALAESGLGVEGLAVAEKTLHVGLRSPVPDGRAVILSAPLDLIFPSGPGGGAGKAGIQTIDLGRDKTGGVRGIRDLVAYKGGFLLIAGPMLDPKPDTYLIQTGDYAIYRHLGNVTTKLLDLDGYVIDGENKVKPEALLPLDETNGVLRALVLFDGPAEGSGRTIRIPLQ